MTPAQTWRALESTLRPFIARRVATPADVDDVLQETFTRVHRGASQVHDDERFGPWVYRIARNAIADHHRMRARHPLRGDEAPEVAEATEEERVFTCRIDEHITALVELLPEPTRTTLRLSELEGRSQADIARTLGVPLTTVRSRVQRGRARLREMVEAMCAVEVDARGRLVACDHRADVCCGPAHDASTHDPMAGCVAEGRA
ncbi:MAG: sigma-70 family RNA polymerase sigma factor [Polyangiales bacterium]